MIKDEETLKNYHKIRDKGVIKLRLNAREKALLESTMRTEEWENISGFIKYKLFGWNPEEKLKNRLKKGDKETILSVLKNELEELNKNFAYIRFRYDKDMAVLYKEEVLVARQWAKATNENHIKLLQKIEDIEDAYRIIMKALGLKFYREEQTDEEIIRREQFAQTGWIFDTRKEYSESEEHYKNKK